MGCRGALKERGYRGELEERGYRGELEERGYRGDVIWERCYRRDVRGERL